MAITAAGVGSGLDIASIVNQLVSAERAPTASRISSQRTRFNAQLSALGTLKGALSTLQSKVDALTADGGLSAYKAKSSMIDQFSATAGAGAAVGTYQIEVLALAKAHKMVSAPYAGADSVLGNGTVEISVGGEAFTVTLTEGANTLADLRSAINKATDNTGVAATLVNEENGTRLLLTSKTAGTETQIAVSSALLTFSESQAAADAHIRIDSFDVYSSGNTISDAIDGITFTLAKEAPGEIGTLTVTRDTSKAKTAVEEFVKAYNTVASLVASQTRYDPATRRASPFTGDAAVRGVMQSLRGIVGGAVSGGTLTALSEMGITTKTDGTLTVDASKLAAALESNPSGVEALFAAEGGIGKRLSSAIDGILDDGGSLDAKSDTLNDRLSGLTRQEQVLDRRIESLQARYTAQFSALDSLIAQMNNTSTFLSQQLNALSKQT